MPRANQKHYHLKSNCTSGLTQVALETALNYGKTACPTCAKVADQEVYATPNGKYYHVSQSCAGSGAVSGSLAKAVALGFKPCPYCVATTDNGANGSTAEISQEVQKYGKGSGTYTAGKSGVKVYSKASDRYYHSSKKCAGSGAVHVTLETALNYGKKACPECCSVAEKTVYAAKGSGTFHARKSHAGDKAVAGTLAKALAYGLKPCSTCFTTTENAGTVTPGKDYSAPADSSVYVDLYSDDYYYHKDSKCSQTGMSGGTKVTLEFAKDLGYADAPTATPRRAFSSIVCGESHFGFLPHFCIQRAPDFGGEVRRFCARSDEKLLSAAKLMLPVGSAEEVLPGAEVVAHAAAMDGNAHLGQRVRRSQTGDSMEHPCRLGGGTAEILALGIGPVILRGGTDVQLPRGDERQQHVLVEGHFEFAVGPAAIVFAEPVGKNTRDDLHAFADFARDRAAPEHPESLETTMAKRSSCAAHHSAVLPRREWPDTQQRRASISGRC